MKNICFISSTRADYGLLKWSMKEIQNYSVFKLQLIVMGMHLSKKFGETYKEIESDGFIIDQKVELGEFGDSKESISNQVAKSLTGVTTALSLLKPDAVVILGDRYEMLGAAQACFFQGIPIVHLHGGEKTEGAIDDVIRHCITKLSKYHITSTEEYRKRVIQLGENPANVFNLGAPGLENFLKLKLLSKSELEVDLKTKFKARNILVTFHPVTNGEEKISELIEALKCFPELGQYISLPNSDLGHTEIIDQLTIYAKNNENVYLFKSIGQLRYTSLMKLVDVVVGNSSSGILESPFAGTSSLNIGNRQFGRIADCLVHHVECKTSSIKNKLNIILNSNDTKSSSLMYGNGIFSIPFLDLLTRLNFENNDKKFYDIE